MKGKALVMGKGGKSEEERVEGGGVKNGGKGGERRKKDGVKTVKGEV